MIDIATVNMTLSSFLSLSFRMAYATVKRLLEWLVRCRSYTVLSLFIIKSLHIWEAQGMASGCIPPSCVITVFVLVRVLRLFVSSFSVNVLTISLFPVVGYLLRSSRRILDR